MRANEVASIEARISELAFVRAWRAKPGGTWFNIARMLGRSEADVRNAYGFVDTPETPADFDPRVKHLVPTETDDGEDDGASEPARPAITGRMHALRLLAREPMTADALAARTGWSETAARHAFLRLRDVGFAVQSHAGIWSITHKGRLAHANLEAIR